MLITDYQINNSTGYLSRAYWDAGDTDYLASLFVSGKFDQNLYSDTWEGSERYAIVALVSGETAQIEIHEFEENYSSDDDSEIFLQDSIYDRANTRPIITWRAVAGATKYKIYRSVDGGTDILVDTVFPFSEYEIQRYKIGEELSGDRGKWHFFRVESIDEYGNESTIDSWPFWVYGPPQAVQGIDVSAGSGGGLFNIEIEE